MGDRDLTAYRLKKVEEDKAENLRDRRAAVLAQRSVATIVKMMTNAAVNNQEEDMAAEGIAAYEVMLDKLQELALDVQAFSPDKKNAVSLLDISPGEALELVEPKVRQALGTASTACPGSAGQERDASPFGVLPSLPSVSPDSVFASSRPATVEARASTAPAMQDVAEKEEFFLTDPEEPPPMASRPIVGVPQQSKLQNVKPPNTFRVQRDLGSLAAMRQIRRTGPMRA